MKQKKLTQTEQNQYHKHIKIKRRILSKTFSHRVTNFLVILIFCDFSFLNNQITRMYHTHITILTSKNFLRKQLRQENVFVFSIFSLFHSFFLSFFLNHVTDFVSIVWCAYFIYFLKLKQTGAKVSYFFLAHHKKMFFCITHGLKILLYMYLCIMHMLRKHL